MHIDRLKVKYIITDAKGIVNQNDARRQPMARKTVGEEMRAGAEAGEETDVLDDGFLTVGEVAEVLRLSRAKIYGMMDAGELPFAKFGKSRRVPRRAVRELAERSMVAAK
jgi:excisionase family DNA binding protein